MPDRAERLDSFAEILDAHSELGAKKKKRRNNTIDRRRLQIANAEQNVRTCKMTHTTESNVTETCRILQSTIRSDKAFEL